MRHYRSYMLGVLVLIFAFNYIDRVALAIVLQNIKIDLRATDTQLGFLSGFGFAAFYAIMGIPIARWADTGNRVRVTTICTALAGLMIAVCGFTASFAQLLLARVGVAVGEAGCIPPAQSLIADSFSRAERPRAAAIYSLGPPLSFLGGFFLSGWLNQFFGWRITFVLLGLPALLMAPIAAFALREPRVQQGGQLGQNEVAPKVPGRLHVCVELWRCKTFRHLLFCTSTIYFFGYGILQWQPTFFIRSYGLTTGQLGTWLALTYGVTGILGSYLGGTIASRFAPNNESLQLKGMALAISSFGLLSFFVYIVSSVYFALGLFALAMVCLNLANGPLFATIQTVVPARDRATAIALVYLFANLIGMGAGPVAVGALSDFLHPWLGDESLRYALIGTGPGYLIGAWYAWKASSQVEQEIAGTAAQAG